MRILRALVVLASCGALLVAGCGSATREIVPEVTSPFTEADAVLFGNGLDLVADPRLLEGQWLDTWEDELDRRVQAADVVALVTVRTLRTDVDLDRRQTLRLLTHVERTYLGEVSEDLTLSVREGQPSFGLVRDNERRLLGEQYIAFVKWADEEGSIRPRWHLSPASEQVALRVRDLLQRRRDVRQEDDVRRRVIIRPN